MKNYAFVSGAAGGLGRAFAVECARRGYNLYLTDIDAKRLSPLAESLSSAYGIDVITHACDLSDITSRNRLFADIAARQIEIVLDCNIAGMGYETSFAKFDSDMISRTIRTNVEATFDVARFCANMPHEGKFYIVNVASLAGFFSMPLMQIYSASKRSIIHFSLAIREELRHAGGHVTVLCPAGMRTNKQVSAKIDSQGFMGRITTLDTGKIASRTIDRVLRNRPVYIPGIVNRILLFAGSLVPDTIKARLIMKRWAARAKMRPEII